MSRCKVVCLCENVPSSKTVFVQKYQGANLTPTNFNYVFKL